jgi:hypothetical protein
MSSHQITNPVPAVGREQETSFDKKLGFEAIV